MTQTILPRNQKISLSDAIARDAPLPVAGHGYILWDSKQLYLGLHVRPGGTKTWIVQKKLGYRPCRVTLGAFTKAGTTGALGYSAAKALVADVVSKINAGINPNSEKKNLRAEIERNRTATTYSVANAVADYRAKLISNNARITTLRDLDLAVERFEQKQLNNVPLTSLTGALLADFYDKPPRSSAATNSGKTQAGRDLRYLRAAYRQARLKNLIPTPPSDPFLMLNELRDGWHRARARSRIVAQTEGDLKRWWLAVEALRPGDPSHVRDVLADYLQLSLLCGGRKGELLGLRWSEVNLAEGYVHIPGERTKNGEDHLFPLSLYAKTLLSKREKVNSARKSPSDYVFPSNRANKAGMVSHLVEPKKAIAAVVSASGIFFTAHDLRRTFGTLLNEMQISEYSLRKALNHAATDTASRHYLRSRLATLRKLYQDYENKVLAEAGVIEAPRSVPNSKLSQLQALLAATGSTPQDFLGMLLSIPPGDPIPDRHNSD